MIDCKDSGSAPAEAAATVATATSETLAIVAAFVNIAAPLAFDLLDTTYVIIIILLSDKALPITPSPKYISNNPASTSWR